MTATDMIKRNEKSQWLRTWQVDPTTFYVESEDGKIAYKCGFSDNGEYCTCADFTTRSKNDPNFKCKHLLSVLNCIPKDEVMEARFLEKRKPKLDERFIKQVDGKDFVLYAGLLDLSHQLHLTGMEVELMQYPMEENDYTAVCKAIARTPGGVFIDWGDANSQNCNSKVAKHLIRMASTRAKARCLRDLTNVGMTALEELGDINEIIGAEANLTNTALSQKDNLKKFPNRQAKAANGNKPVVESDAGNMKAQDAAKPITAKDLPNKPDDYPKESGQATSIQAKANNPAQPSTDKPAEDKPASARQPAKPNNGNGKSKTDVKVPIMSEAQKSAIMNLSRRRNISVAELESLAMKSFNIPLENLSSTDASQFIRTLQTAA
jgi:hypothetical protein